jgi:hypothetical protein
VGSRQETFDRMAMSMAAAHYDGNKWMTEIEKLAATFRGMGGLPAELTEAMERARERMCCVHLALNALMLDPKTTPRMIVCCSEELIAPLVEVLMADDSPFTDEEMFNAIDMYKKISANFIWWHKDWFTSPQGKALMKAMNFKHIELAPRTDVRIVQYSKSDGLPTPPSEDDKVN